MKVNKKKKNKEGPKLAMEVEKQQIRSCILAVLQAGRYKPWEKRPKKERNKGEETGQENIRIRRREKRQRLKAQSMESTVKGKYQLRENLVIG